PIIDSSYDFAEIFIFKNKADHDAYQVDPIHVDFVNSCKSYWSSVKIYDFE
ncbi:Dabb family protein, partial [bacterium]|nr:Dabb family protein [bacterium]